MNGDPIPVLSIRRAAEERDALLRAACLLGSSPRPERAAKLCVAMLCLCAFLLVPLGGAALAARAFIL